MLLTLLRFCFLTAIYSLKNVPNSISFGTVKWKGVTSDIVRSLRLQDQDQRTL